MEQLLRIDNLMISFHTENGVQPAVKGVNLVVRQGETLALVGESGCGKTVICKSMLRILCARGRTEGQIVLNDVDLTTLSEQQMQEVRGSRIAMIFQDPMTSLNPTICVGEQIAEVVRLHRGLGRQQAREEAVKLLEKVGISHCASRYGQMPHQFSGGQRQRIAIAIALAGDPLLLLADEPTTALDEATQEEILKLLSQLQKERDMATIFITHDLSIVEEVADRVAIMKDGLIVEEGLVQKVFAEPAHDYTKKLLGYLDYGKRRGHTHGQIQFHGDGGYDHQQSGRALVEIRGLCKNFQTGGHRSEKIRVLDSLDLDVYRGEVLGIVGPSGCGKSTLARCVMDIYQPDGGEIRFFPEPNGGPWKQMIFQDSASALNPRMKVEQLIGEPLRIRDKKTPNPQRIQDLMEQVELSSDLIGRYPYELSGGQRQRVAIARALAVDPQLIVADEPISSLDISIQAQIIHLFKKLQEQRGLTLMIIAHDLPMVQHISDRIFAFKQQR